MILYENGIAIGQVSGWGFIHGKTKYQEIRGIGGASERVPVSKEPDRCVFESPRPISTTNSFFVVFENMTQFNILVTNVRNGTQVQAIITSKEQFNTPKAT